MARNPKIIAIQTAKRWLINHRNFTDQAYRLLLRNAGGVESSTQLSNDGFEKVMAVMEAMGFADHRDGPSYWQDKAARGGGRITWKIYALHGMPAAQRYELHALCLRFSHHRTDKPEELDGQESYQLIEMLKDVIAREQPEPALSPDDLPF